MEVIKDPIEKQSMQPSLKPNQLISGQSQLQQQQQQQYQYVQQRQQQQQQQPQQQQQQLQNNPSNPKVQIPISWREELYMVKEKVLEEIEELVSEKMKVEEVDSAEAKQTLEQLKSHFKKRLKGFYNSVIVTFRDNVEYVNFEEFRSARSKKPQLYTLKDHSLEEANTNALASFRELIAKTEAVKLKMVDQIQDRIDADISGYKASKKQEAERISANQKQQQPTAAAAGTAIAINTNNTSLINQTANQEKIIIVDDQNVEKEVGITNYVSLCLDPYKQIVATEQQKMQVLMPELNENLKSFHVHTRNQIKKTIELQYALENVKKTRLNSTPSATAFSLPEIPSQFLS